LLLVVNTLKRGLLIGIGPKPYVYLGPMMYSAFSVTKHEKVKTTKLIIIHILVITAR